jgi:DNA-binding IscR family transcriptional regulator
MKFSKILRLLKQGKGTASSHMKNLIEMATVAGNLEQVELKTIAKRNGISENQLKEIQKNPSSDSV